MTHGIDTSRLAVWMNRSFSAIAVELRFVDSGSLDVLLFCADDLAAEHDSRQDTLESAHDLRVELRTGTSVQLP